MKVEDIMVKKVKSILPSTSINEAIKELRKNRISGLPVIDQNNKLIGMLTEKGIMSYILPSYISKVGAFVYAENPKAIRNKVQELLGERKVQDIMREDVITISPEASLSELARIMLTKNVRRVPVVDKENKVVGIVAREDVLNAFIEKQIL